MAIRLSPEITDEQPIRGKIADATISLCAARSRAARHRVPRLGDDLAGCSIITHSNDLARDLDAVLKPRFDPAQIITHCSDPVSIRAAGRARFGVGMVSITVGVPHANPLYPTALGHIDSVLTGYRTGCQAADHRHGLCEVFPSAVRGQHPGGRKQAAPRS